MDRIETLPWDPVDYLDSPEAMAAYLNAAFEDGDPAVIAAALGDVARARGISGLARETGLGRTNLYKSLSNSGRPELSTVLKVVHSLGLRLTVEPAAPKR